jgi:hypothetical protein
MKQIIVVKPGSIKEADRAILTGEGIVIIEHEKPFEVRVINNIEGFDGDDIFNSALQTINESTSDVLRSKFTGLLLTAIGKKRK